MNRVLEAFETSKNVWVLICEGDAPGEKTTLQTSIGKFSPEEYVLGTCTHCFSEKSVFAVRINTEKDCSSLYQVNFK